MLSIGRQALQVQLGSPYFFKLSLNKTNTSKTTLFKLDSGAAKTLIPITFFNREPTELINYIKREKKGSILQLRSASGHVFDTCCCTFKDIKVGDAIFEKFYCFVALDTDVKDALLGRDFLDFCSFTHLPIKKAVTLSEFNYDEYDKWNAECQMTIRKNCTKQGSVEELEVLSLNDLLYESQSDKTILKSDSLKKNKLSERTKNVAASFRDFYGSLFPNMKDNK